MTLEQLLGIELPIIQAPMAGAQGSTLAAAVSNAGGLGSLPCAMLSPTSATRAKKASNLLILRSWGRRGRHYKVMLG